MSAGNSKSLVNRTKFFKQKYGNSNFKISETLSLAKNCLSLGKSLSLNLLEFSEKWWKNKPGLLFNVLQKWLQ